MIKMRELSHNNPFEDNSVFWKDHHNALCIVICHFSNKIHVRTSCFIGSATLSYDTVHSPCPLLLQKILNYVTKWCFHWKNGVGGHHHHFLSETQFTVQHSKENSQYCSDIPLLNSEIQRLSYKAGRAVGLPCTNLWSF